ncbi:tRNA pseudouridine(13) synthase TruD [Pelovirga terrestris]|uniref:tRNA pseudouridine synthase D n=1 Tax=Pelovirga terrestris TaxID=2771352 RepID=A0A8J6QXT1_9BACT|nr:tRNA pseudouridine(13) synthase TruD [Pelovirga terrestris]MBD1401061.1 tRNA pseudouridine(13) synthase TruD [Pelovirga terrestris]
MTFVTADLPGIGGSYKETPTDFEVEEIPLYPCCGSGEHLYLWIEKSGISTSELISRLARRLHLKENDIGYAGLKDSRALTRQWLSIPAAKHSHLDHLHLDNVRILDTQRHTNKLRLGHLAGNRFSICLRQLNPGVAPQADAILAELHRCGVPNRFGEQRYGILGNSALLGHLLLTGDHQEFCRELLGDPQKIGHPGWKKAALAYRQQRLEDALNALPGAMRLEQRLIRDLLQGKNHQQAVYRLPKQRLRFFLSALQSRYFDQLLETRIGALGELKDGDIAYKHINGACFLVETAEQEQARADSFEISPTAPLFGHKVMLAQGEPGTAEAALLNRSNLTLDSWKPAPGLAMPGERRPLRVPLELPKIAGATDDSLTIEFALPKGSYATSVLAELMKTP